MLLSMEIYKKGSLMVYEKDVVPEVTDTTIKSLVLLIEQGNIGKMARLEVWRFGLAGTAYPVEMLGDRKAVCCFCVYQHGFFCVCWQNRPRATPAQLSWHQRSGSTITGTHTLSSSQSFAPVGTKAQCGETERGDDNPQWGFGGVGKTREGD